MNELFPSIVSPENGTVLRAFGEEVIVYLGAKQTGGSFCCFLETTSPGGGPPPHYHENEDEWFFPLEGEVEFYLNGEWKAVPLETTVFVPRGTVHGFRNPGTQPLRMLIHTSPAGFETFFARCAEEFARSATPDMERIMAIAAEHGIFFLTE